MNWTSKIYKDFKQKMLTPEEKSLTLAYAHCELLKHNLNFTIHEMKVKGKKYDHLVKRLNKLRTVAHEAFLEINSIIKKNYQADALKQDIEQILDQTWTER